MIDQEGQVLVDGLKEQMKEVYKYIEDSVKIMDLLKTGEEILEKEDIETKLKATGDMQATIAYLDMSIRLHMDIFESTNILIKSVETDGKISAQDAATLLVSKVLSSAKYSRDNYKDRYRKIVKNVLEKTG